jgi:NCS1 family nucleobase:cation symporter-1
LSRPSTFHTVGEFWSVFVPQLTGIIGFWATLSLNIPDFTRFGRGQREQILGQTLGLPTTMIAFSAMGVVVTSASHQLLNGLSPEELERLWDPVVILSHITAAAPPPGHAEPLIASGAVRLIVAVIALFGIAVATISVNIAANVVSPANDFANLAPRHISFKTGGLITGIVGIFMLPWKLMASVGDYIFTWLIGYSALLGPIAGIMVVDYWIVRKRRLDVPDLYRLNGQYPRFNPVAIVALIVGVLPNIPGFLHAAGAFSSHPELWASLGAGFWDAIYVYAWFTGFLLAGLGYWIGMRVAPPAAQPVLVKG